MFNSYLEQPKNLRSIPAAQYDFVIAGGGLSGLSLAYHLAHSPLGDKSILIVDQSPKSQNDPRIGPNLKPTRSAEKSDFGPKP